MINKYRHGEITAGQFYVLIISIMIGSGVLGLSRSVALIAKQDAWISVILNGLIISTSTAMAVYVASKYPSHSFLEYTSKLLGRPLAYLLLLSYSIYAVFSTSLIIRYLSEMVGTWFLPRTPNIITTLLIVLTTLYIINDGLTLVGRFNEIIIFTIVAFIILIFPSLSKASLLNLRPVGGAGIINILKGVIPSYYSFAGFEIVLLFYPLISNRNGKIIRNSVYSIFFVTFFYAITVASQVALFGYIELGDILYVSINYLDVIDPPVIERLEIFFAIFWSFSVIGTITIQYIAGSISLQSIIKTKKVSFFSYLCAPIICFLSLYPKNSVEVVKLSDMLGKFTIFFGIALPLMLFAAYFIKGRKRHHEKIH